MIVGISGASGVIYGVRLLAMLRDPGISPSVSTRSHGTFTSRQITTQSDSS